MTGDKLESPANSDRWWGLAVGLGGPEATQAAMRHRRKPD